MPETRTLRAYVELVGKEQFEKELKDLEGKGTVAAKSIGTAFEESGGSLSRFGQKLGRVGSELTQYVTLPLAALSAGTLKLTTDVLKSNDAIATLSTEGRANARALLTEWDELKGGLTDVRNELVEGMLPVYRDLVQFANDELVPVLKDIVHQFSEQSKEAKEAEIKVAAVLAVMGPGIKIAADFAIGIAAVKYAFGGLRAEALMLLPILIAINEALIIGRDIQTGKRPTGAAGAGMGAIEGALPGVHWIIRGGEFLSNLWGGGKGPEQETVAAGVGTATERGWDDWAHQRAMEAGAALRNKGAGPVIRGGGGGGGGVPAGGPGILGAYDFWLSLQAQRIEAKYALAIQGMMREWDATWKGEGFGRWPNAAGELMGQEYSFNYGGAISAQKFGTGKGGAAAPAWQRNDFLWQTAFAAAGPLMQGGGAQDALAGALPGLGYGIAEAISVGGGPIGGGIGMILAGLFGKKQRGESPQNPVYVKDINTGNLLTEMLNATKSNLARAGAGAIDTMFRDLRMQGITRGLA